MHELTDASSDSETSELQASSAAETGPRAALRAQRAARRKAKRRAAAAARPAAGGLLVAVAANQGWLHKVRRLIERRLDEGPYDFSIVCAREHKQKQLLSYLEHAASHPPAGSKARQFSAADFDAILSRRSLFRCRKVITKLISAVSPAARLSARPAAVPARTE